MLRWLKAVLALVLVSAPAAAASAGEPVARVENEHTKAELYIESQSAAPGEPVWVGMRFIPTEGWHTYWKNYGDSGKPPGFHWDLPEGWTAGEPRYPVPERIRVGPLMNYGYKGAQTLLIKLTPPETLSASKSRIALEAEWLVCEEICIPESGKFAFTLARGDGAVDPAQREVFAAARAALPSEAPWQAKAELSDRAFRLSLDMTEAEAGLVESAYFFPHQEGLVNYTAEQAVAAGGDGLRLTVARPSYSAEIERASGVLVIENAGGEREGFAVAAPIEQTPNLTAAAAAGTGGGAGAAGSGAGVGSGALELALPTALAFALLGGVLLNLMPCVFPVLSLKAFSLIRSHGAGEPAARRDGLAYTAGILVSFALVGGALMGLRAAGEQVGWGFQLQQPAIIAGLALVLFLVGLNLAGMFTIPARWSGLGQGLTERSGFSGAFFTGVLATVVAAPCTAPFMAPALGFAVFQSAPVALAIFLSLGLGLALPYLAVSYLPVLRRALPKPGPWMERLRQLLAFPMFLTAVWLVWVLSQQAGPDAVALALSAMVAAAFVIWLFQQVRGGRSALRGGATAVSLLLASGLVYAGAAVLSQGSRTAEAGGQTAGKQAAGLEARLGVEPWSQQRVDTLTAEGRPVFVYFTAAWCITCKANERVALADSAVIEAVNKHDIAVLKADWTDRDDAIAQALSRFGRSGVPLYLVYPPGGEPQVLPQVLTPGRILEAFDRALAQGAAG